MENQDLKNPQFNITKLNSQNYLYFLSFDEIMSIFRNSKYNMSIYKQNYLELENQYSKYYNLNTRKKLNNIIPLLEESLS
jgi:hypothetical protein